MGWNPGYLLKSFSTLNNTKTVFYFWKILQVNYHQSFQKTSSKMYQSLEKELNNWRTWNFSQFYIPMFILGDKTQEVCFSKWKYALVLTIDLFVENSKFCFILGMVFHFSAKTAKKISKFRWKVKTWGNLGHGLFIVIYNTHACHTFGRRPWGAGLPLRITVPSEFQKVWWR